MTLLKHSGIFRPCDFALYDGASAQNQRRWPPVAEAGRDVRDFCALARSHMAGMGHLGAVWRDYGILRRRGRARLAYIVSGSGGQLWAAVDSYGQLGQAAGSGGELGEELGEAVLACCQEVFEHGLVLGGGERHFVQQECLQGEAAVAGDGGVYYHLLPGTAFM